MLKRNGNNKAFTLTELLITISLVGLIFLAAVVIQQTADKFYYSTSLKSSVQTNAGYAMEKIVRSIRGSASATIANSETLNLSNKNGTTVAFWLDKNKNIIYWKNGNNPEEILAKNAALEFSQDGNIIKIYLRVESEKKGGITVPLELHSSALPRNQ